MGTVYGGSRVTIDIQLFNAPPVDALIGAVSKWLTGTGNSFGIMIAGYKATATAIGKTYQQVASLAPFLVPFLPDIGGYIPFTGVVEIIFITNNDKDYGNENDIALIVSSAFQSFGVTPSQIIVTEVFDGAGDETFSAEPIDTSDSASSSIIDDIGNAISKFFSGLKQTTITILIVIAAIIVLVLILVAYGPNVKHIAAAV